MRFHHRKHYCRTDFIVLAFDFTRYNDGWEFGITIFHYNISILVP